MFSRIEDFDDYILNMVIAINEFQQYGQFETFETYLFVYRYLKENHMRIHLIRYR